MFGDMPESSIRVLLADECENRRRTIRHALITGATVCVLGEAADFDELLAEVETRQPRVLVVSDDLLREQMDVALAQLRAVGNTVRTLMLTESSAADSPCAPLRDHVWGCLIYPRIEQDLVKAVTAIAGGEMWFSRRELAEMLRARAECVPPVPSEQIILRGLTCREIEVVHLIARGKTNKEIAQAMSISALTVKTHVQNIFKKCGLRRRTELPGQMMAA
jgi:DNA-binding NarL/FixJ family response regulator